MSKDYFEGQQVEWTDLYKDDRERMRPIIGAIILAASLAAIALYLLPKAFAGHDIRDPEGICFSHAQIAATWAGAARDEAGKTKVELEKLVVITPEALEQVPEKYRKLVLQHTVKGIELVFDANPQKTPQEVGDEFYDWCLDTLPKAPGA